MGIAGWGDVHGEAHTHALTQSSSPAPRRSGSVLRLFPSSWTAPKLDPVS